MNLSIPSEDELAVAIEYATKSAVTKLFQEYPGKYYYLSLITTGEAHTPVLAAWSEEALEEAVQDATDKDDARWGLKWSYADSPYYCFGEQYFQEVNELFAMRPEIRSLKDEARKNEFELRLRAMEKALARLDQQGVFGSGVNRLSIVVNAEVMPPDYTNIERAIRLNPREALSTWLQEAAESD